ncbi:phosphoribosylanthranilate isomerase [Rummeliibacillus sp. JY-2-4R]
MTKVKICGLMKEENVKAAVEAGADAIGFVFAKSKRQISIEKAAQLAKLIPENILKIGVFVNASEEFILKAYHEVPLDLIQFHGNETNEEIKNIGLPSIKACSIKSKEDIDFSLTYETDYLLLDAPGIEFAGGSGKVFDWSLLNNPKLINSKVILAGGLTAANVENAIEISRADMVDVSSGVEIDGQKDNQLITEFINAVKKGSLLNGERTK